VVNGKGEGWFRLGLLVLFFSFSSPVFYSFGDSHEACFLFNLGFCLFFGLSFLSSSFLIIIHMAGDEELLYSFLAFVFYLL
jgi:hypothetical protein